MRNFAVLLVGSLLASCISAPPKTALAYDIDAPGAVEPVAQDPRVPSKPRSGRPEWHRGQTLMQGFFGITEFQSVERSGGGTPDVDGDEGDLDEFPVFGGGAQYKLGGERIDWGLEGMFSFGGSANSSAFVVGGGGAAVAIDVDLLVLDFYFGPFISTFLGDNIRLYGAAGPLFEWADYEQSNALGTDDGSGFGFGTYARTGIEFMVQGGTLLGVGVRWSDTSVDLGSDLGDLEMDGFQLLFTVSRGI